jgi:hypothetical protein
MSKALIVDTVKLNKHPFNTGNAYALLALFSYYISPGCAGVYPANCSSISVTFE